MIKNYKQLINSAKEHILFATIVQPAVCVLQLNLLKKQGRFFQLIPLICSKLAVLTIIRQRNKKSFRQEILATVHPVISSRILARFIQINANFEFEKKLKKTIGRLEFPLKFICSIAKSYSKKPLIPCIYGLSTYTTFKKTNMRIHIISIAIFSLVLLSCQEPKEDEEAQEVEKIRLEQSVLNVNIASKDDLASLGLSEELNKVLLEKRPFLNMIQLDELLSEIENKDELYEIIYVPQNLNTTEKVNFKLIPGVGERMANRFEKYRPYSSMKQFRRAISKYVEHEEVARFEQYVFVPIELNTASEESIKALPGFGYRIADEFKANRPYSSMEQFRKALGEHLDSKELSRLERLVYLKEAK